MAVTKIWKINGWIGDCLLYIGNPNKTQNPLVIGDPKLKEEEYQSLTDVIEYAEDGNKTVRDTERFVSGVNCDAETARQEMILAKNAFDKNDGICAYHAIQSFAPGEVTPETAHEIGIRLAKEMWGERYQVLVATHLDHEHIHNHFVINSVSFLDGKRLWKEKNYWQMRTVSDALCREYGLSLIKPVRRGMPYATWQAEKEGKPNRRKVLREDIDHILANENIESLEAFYDTLRAYGYAVMTDRKYVAICPPGGERNIRLQSLGENYEPEALHLHILRIKADRLLGKTKVIEQPMTPKRKMRLRGTVRRKSKAHGIRALYYKWLYYLGVFKRHPKVYGSAFTTARWQLNAYVKQFDYVAKYDLKTCDDVEQRLRVVQHEISEQIDEREEVRTVLRCLETGDAEIQEQLEKIEKINVQLKKLRSEAKLCVQILEQQPQIKSKIEKAHEVKTFETERGKENGRTSDHHLEHRRNEAAPTREQRSSGSARSGDPIQRR